MSKIGTYLRKEDNKEYLIYEEYIVVSSGVISEELENLLSSTSVKQGWIKHINSLDCSMPHGKYEICVFELGDINRLVIQYSVEFLEDKALLTATSVSNGPNVKNTCEDNRH